MDKGNILDKTWIALELTKIGYKNSCSHTDEEIFNTFTNYLSMLFDEKLEELDKIKDYKKHIIELETINLDLRKDFDNKLDEIMEITFKNAIEMLDSCKGDMEDYVYKNLKELLTNKK